VWVVSGGPLKEGMNMPVAIAGRNQKKNILIYDNSRHSNAIIDVLGDQGAFKYELTPQIVGIDTSDPVGFTTTVVEAGTGTTEFSVNNTVGRVGTITCAADENDGGSYQLLGEHFSCASSEGWYVGMSAQMVDVDQTDLLFGVCITDTALLGGMTDGVYFESLDGSSAIGIVAEKDSTETTGGTTATISDATDFIIEMVWDGTKLHAYVDNTKIYSDTPANAPDDEALRLSLEVLTGEAVANTLNVEWLRAFRWRLA